MGLFDPLASVLRGQRIDELENGLLVVRRKLFEQLHTPQDAPTDTVPVLRGLSSREAQ